MEDLRVNVCARVQVADDTIKPDLMDPSMTQDNLIRLLDRATAPPDKGGLGYSLLITSLRRDHGDDSQLGPHGHARGFAVDLWPTDVCKLRQFVQDMATKNHWVTKIGLGGQAQELTSRIVPGATIIFQDNNTDHIHLQTA